MGTTNALSSTVGVILVGTATVTVTATLALKTRTATENALQRIAKVLLARQAPPAPQGLLGLIPARITYIIDKQGVIRKSFRHDLSIGKHLSDTLAALDAVESVKA